MIKELSISDYINKNKLVFESELIQFLSIPSVSTDPKRSSRVLEAANFVKTLLGLGGTFALAERCSLQTTPPLV